MGLIGREVRGAIAAAVFLAGLLPGRAGAAANGCLACHGNVAADTFVHDPVAAGECLSCHRPAPGKIHPGDKEAVVLTERVGKLCSQCHETQGSKKHVHTPVLAGECIACHDPHHSPLKDQLKKKPASLCLQCHETINVHQFTHPPVASGNCTACHDPHQSDNRYQLVRPGAALCQSCHKKTLFTGKFVHGPVRSGNCTACHDPHGSEFPRLLKKNFSTEFYLAYDERNFTLCFDCHNREIAFDLRTETATSFRDGNMNLHAVHINRQVKGRSCKTCHDPHASNQDKLIKEKVQGFGKWDIPIKYVKTSTGGTCIVGCHKPRSYDRFNDTYTTP